MSAREAAAEPGGPTNGSPGTPTHESESRPEREYHAESREAAASHEPAPIAHFEPQSKPDTGAPANKPYVVWSSAPPEKDSGGRGSEE
jgi:hypothetical protein